MKKLILKTFFILTTHSSYCQTLTTGLNNTVGHAFYESTDHRSNTYEVVSDQKKFDNNQFSAMVISHTDYYPYGMIVGNGMRSKQSDDYRFGFQGQEKDDKVKGKGNSVNYKYRMHDSRVGRFFAVDPLSGKYPHYSSYQFSGNKTISRVELEGLEDGPAQNSNNGANKEEGLTADAYTQASTSTSLSGVSLNYKFKYSNTPNKVTFAANFSNVTSLYHQKNGVNEIGFSTTFSLASGIAVNDKNGVTKFTFLYGLEFRGHSGHFSKESNITGSINFAWRWKKSNHAITVGNDFATPSLGFNGDTGKLMNISTDGGLTMHANYSWLYNNNNSGFSIKLYGTTPHRTYDENNETLVKDGKLSSWGTGVFRTNMYEGAYQSVGTINRIFTNNNVQISLGMGVQGKLAGQNGQNGIHKALGYGEFEGWNDVNDYMYFEFSVSKKIK